MGRFVLRKPAASSDGAILSSACMDKGKSIWRGTTNNSWETCYGDENLITLKIIKDNPLFDIEWVLGTDHVTTWNSQAFRLIARYGTNSNANDSSWKGPNIMDQHGLMILMQQEVVEAVEVYPQGKQLLWQWFLDNIKTMEI